MRGWRQSGGGCGGTCDHIGLGMPPAQARTAHAAAQPHCLPAASSRRSRTAQRCRLARRWAPQRHALQGRSISRCRRWRQGGRCAVERASGAAAAAPAGSPPSRPSSPPSKFLTRVEEQEVDAAVLLLHLRQQWQRRSWLCAPSGGGERYLQARLVGRLPRLRPDPACSASAGQAGSPSAERGDTFRRRRIPPHLFDQLIHRGLVGLVQLPEVEAHCTRGEGGARRAEQVACSVPRLVNPWGSVLTRQASGPLLPILQGSWGEEKLMAGSTTAMSMGQVKSAPAGHVGVGRGRDGVR